MLIARSGYSHGLKVLARDYQNKFQLESYERLSKVIEEVEKNHFEYILSLKSINSSWERHYNNCGKFVGYSPDKILRLKNDLQNNYTHNLDKLDKAISSIIIVEPKLELYKLTILILKSGNFQKSNEAYSIFDDYTKNIFSKHEIEELDRKIRPIIELAFEGLSYIDNLKQDLQNILLGGVYEHNIKRGKFLEFSNGRLNISIDDYAASQKALFAKYTAQKGS